MAEAKIVGEDMISELSVDLLVVILGLIPTKDAVATMILSKRWLSIWTMVSRLEYKDADADTDDEDDDDDDDESKKSVWWLLDKSLQLHEAPIDRLSVKLGTRCPADVDVGKWVAKAVACFVNKLEFKLLWSADPTTLPCSLYSCKSLVELTLSHQITVDVPSSASLPSLIHLDLVCVVYKDEGSLLSLLSSCPVLNLLFVQRRKDDNIKKFTIKVPSLCELWYSNFSLGNDSDTDRCLVLDAPALTSCNISDSSGDSFYSIQDMPSLENAHIDVAACDDTFLASLSSVLSLCLFLCDALLMRCSTINFSRLIKLTISPYGSYGSSDSLNLILLLLGNASKLQQLCVNYQSEPAEDLPGSWNQSNYVPLCLSSQLQIFEWGEYGNQPEEETFLTYIFANSKHLKTAIISLRSDFNLELQELIIEELKYIPRVSTTSQLLFK
ncbi:hypothetical protein AALP_AA8G373900 [Arabis alpina]|uniref:FBD domain-containing protein n=1 Tax=Arabis alpina TaxID=50452 RepID=A0A087GBW6_ARAAL|nr:hypothetical protein AALP_AA8G373900 [Arabis alpina]